MSILIGLGRHFVSEPVPFDATICLRDFVHAVFKLCNVSVAYIARDFARAVRRLALVAMTCCKAREEDLRDQRIVSQR